MVKLMVAYYPIFPERLFEAVVPRRTTINNLSNIFTFFGGIILLKLKRLFCLLLGLTTLIGGSTLMVNAEKKTEEKKTSYTHELDAQSYNGNDLGAVYTKKATTFKVWAPTASRVAVRLYTTGSSDEEGAAEISTTTMNKGKNGVWSVKIDGDLKNKYYTYLVINNGVSRETADIYAKACGVNGNRSMVVDLDSTDPEGWEKDKHVLYDDPTDAIVWEVHVKDFSSSEVSGISAKYRGKYLAFTEDGSTLGGKGDVPTCINYLKSLGVTHVQLLPVYDYATVDESDQKTDQFNWGYDPKNYNVPEGSYSTDPYNGTTRINEFKQMIMALHNAGIGVIMDVVYNHTFSGENSWFEYTVPGYYYRMKEDGSFGDGSGCGNETASEHLMYRKYMTDSVVYWADEYHIDGFRFDLMGVHDVETMNGIRKALDTKIKDGKKIIMYGEPWTGGSLTTTVPTATKENIKQLDNRIGAFNDVFRDAVKGHVFNAVEKGFVQNGSGKGLLVGAITGNTVSASKFNQPSQTVTYTSAHDNYTLYDKLVLSMKNDMSYDERDESIVKANKLSAAITLTSQGICFMQAGEEFARTKHGDENSYKSSTKINQLDWNSLIKYADVRSYYSGLMDIRRNYKPLRDPTTKSANLVTYSETGDGVIAYTLENQLTNDREWAQLAVGFNSTDKEAEVQLVPRDGGKLPEEWTVIADGTSAGLKRLGNVKGNKIKIAPHSAVILVDKKSFDSCAIKNERCYVHIQHKETGTDKIIEEYDISGRQGDGFKTSENENLGVEYDYQSVEGEEEGKFTSKDRTVTYYYKKFNGSIYNLNVNYLSENTILGETQETEAAPPAVVKVRENSDYSAPIKEVQGMELDLSLFPTNAVGRVNGTDITVNYYYKEVEKSDLIVHYYNSNSYKKVGAYIYRVNEDGEISKEYTDSDKGAEMTADKSRGDNWYTITVKEAGSLDNVYAIFTDMGKNSDSGQSPDGYSVKGECCVKNGSVQYSGKVNVLYVQSNGKVLNTLSMSDLIGEKYSTMKKSFDGLVFSASTGNTSGIYTASPVYVIYSYDEAPITEKPVMTVIIVLGASAFAMFAAAGIIAVSYKRKKSKIVVD